MKKERWDALCETFSKMRDPLDLEYSRFALIEGKVNGEEAGILVGVVATGPQQGVLIPMFVSITPSMKLEDHEGKAPKEEDTKVSLKERVVLVSALDGEQEMDLPSGAITATYIAALLACKVDDLFFKQIEEEGSFELITVWMNSQGFNPSFPFNRDISTLIGRSYCGDAVKLYNIHNVEPR